MSTQYSADPAQESARLALERHPEKCGCIYLLPLWSSCRQHALADAIGNARCGDSVDLFVNMRVSSVGDVVMLKYGILNQHASVATLPLAVQHNVRKGVRTAIALPRQR
jgi:hypothetical protein